jgi:hypothetical protein
MIIGKSATLASAVRNMSIGSLLRFTLESARMSRAVSKNRLAAMCLLYVTALSVSASAQWRRVVLGGKGISDDISAVHPLTYFTSNPFLRDDGMDLCISCTAVGKAKSALRFDIRTELKPVGSLAGYQIFDVLYYISPKGEESSDQVKWKSIVVQVAPNRYREIFHLQNFFSSTSINASRIVVSGTERVLASVDSDGGNAGGCYEAYWWLDASGPHALDFSRLVAAVQRGVPEDTAFSLTCSSLDLTSQQVRSAVQKKNARCHACDYVGFVTATFQLKGAVLLPTTVEFKPDVRP